MVLTHCLLTFTYTVYVLNGRYDKIVHCDNSETCCNIQLELIPARAEFSVTFTDTSCCSEG